MRAAVVGGVAYHAGTRRAEGQAAEADQEARIADLEAQQYQQQAAPPPPPPVAAAPAPSGGISEQGIEELKKLAELKEQGILTDAEFEVQKAKILQGG